MTIIQGINNRLDKQDEGIKKIVEEIYGEKGIYNRIKINDTWIVQSTVKLKILFGVLSFLGITFSGLIITLLFEILTHKVTIGF